MKEKRPRIIRPRDRSENDPLGNFNARSNRYDRSDDEQTDSNAADDDNAQQERNTYRQYNDTPDEDGGGGYQNRNYNRDGGGYQNRNYNRDGGGGGYQNRNYNNDQQQGDGGGGYQNRNYNRDGGGGGYQNRNYNRDGGGGGYQNRNYNRDGGDGYQNRNSGGYQNRNNNRQQDFRSNNYQRFHPEPPQYRDVSLFTNAENGVRLNKFLSNAGVASRRKADELIAEGQISVNNVVVTEMGYRIQESDTVIYEGKRVYPGRKVYVLLNKPKDTITTTDDPQGRHTVMELIDNAAEDRLYPIGRLDRNSTGVLMLTNDGELAQKLSHPSSEIRKIYHIVLDKPLTKNDFQRILDGVELEDGMIKVDDLGFPYGDDKTQVGIEIHSGKNRIIRRLFDHLEYNVLRLDRVMYAGLTKKGLKRGDWRYLTEKEVGWLRRMNVKRENPS